MFASGAVTLTILAVLTLRQRPRRTMEAFMSSTSLLLGISSEATKFVISHAHADGMW
jgi:hypothetical protein